MLLDPVAERDAGAPEPEAPAQSTIPIIEALDTLGYEPEVLPLQADVPHEWIERLRSGEFRVAFNLCESVRGSPAAEHLAAAAVELLGLADDRRPLGDAPQLPQQGPCCRCVARARLRGARLEAGPPR